jgi:hypothetical protein
LSARLWQCSRAERLRPLRQWCRLAKKIGGNRWQGSFIGTGATGTAALSDAQGLYLNALGNRICGAGFPLLTSRISTPQGTGPETG